MDKLIRLRLQFEPPPAQVPQRCCFLLDPKRCRVVADLCHSIAQDFELPCRTTSLSLGEYSLLPGDDVKILRDDDVVQVSYTPLPGFGAVSSESRKRKSTSSATASPVGSSKIPAKRSASHQSSGSASKRSKPTAQAAAKSKKTRKPVPVASSSESSDSDSGSEDSSSDSSSSPSSSAASSSSDSSSSSSEDTTAKRPSKQTKQQKKPQAAPSAASSVSPKPTTAVVSGKPSAKQDTNKNKQQKQPQQKQQNKQQQQEQQQQQQGKTTPKAAPQWLGKNLSATKSQQPASAVGSSTAFTASKAIGGRSHVVFDSDGEESASSIPQSSAAVSTVASTTMGSSSTNSFSGNNRRQAVATTSTPGQSLPGGRGRGRGRGNAHSPMDTSDSDFTAGQRRQSWDGQNRQQRGGAARGARGGGGGRGGGRGRGRGRGGVTGGPNDVFSYSSLVIESSDDMRQLADAAAAWTASVKRMQASSSASTSSNPTTPSTTNTATPSVGGVNSTTPSVNGSGHALPQSATAASHRLPSPSGTRTTPSNAAVTASQNNSMGRNGQNSNGGASPCPPVPACQPAAVKASAASTELRDYSLYPAIKGMPNVGATIAFKVLELSASYTPEISCFKEGTVLSVDTEEDCLTVKLRPECVPPAPDTDTEPGKFDLVYSDSDEEGEISERPQQQPSKPRDEMVIQLSNVLEMKALPE